MSKAKSTPPTRATRTRTQADVGEVHETPPPAAPEPWEVPDGVEAARGAGKAPLVPPPVPAPEPPLPDDDADEAALNQAADEAPTEPGKRRPPPDPEFAAASPDPGPPPAPPPAGDAAALRDQLAVLQAVRASIVAGQEKAAAELAKVDAQIQPLEEALEALEPKPTFQEEYALVMKRSDEERAKRAAAIGHFLGGASKTPLDQVMGARRERGTKRPVYPPAGGSGGGG